jgi:hypothetical protein
VRIARVVVPVAVALTVTPGASSTPSSGLRGTVAIPVPVCLQDQPCSKNGPGVKLRFWRAGRAVASVVSGEGGRYRIALAPGLYTVSSPSAMRPKGTVRPSPVRVVAGRFRAVDFFVDTGIRAFY